MSMRIEIDLPTQRLRLLADSETVGEWSISSAQSGAGELLDSECTPCGVHRIAEKIGADCALNAVFVGRSATGEIYSSRLRDAAPERDWILTRILWLAGCEPGRNQGGEVDSQARCIYIHGAPDDVQMAVPGSRGCIRMRNDDVVAVFERVCVDTEVVIA